MTTKRDKSDVMSGWCITGHHDKCDTIYMKIPVGDQYGCSCKHHDSGKVDKKSTKK